MTHEATHPNPGSLRWRKMERLWHVGSLNAADKGKTSQEGQGLSVSKHPQEWSSIARLGDQVFELRRQGGRFLDFHALTKAQRQSLVAWGIAADLLEMRPMWKLSWLDGETEEGRHCLFSEQSAAQAEADWMREEGTEAVELVAETRPALSAKAVSRIGFKLDALLAEDMVATFWVEDCTDADGVWWQDTLDPSALSAPRGVINLRQLPGWSVRGPLPLW